jgi:hypothetical protein
VCNLALCSENSKSSVDCGLRTVKQDEDCGTGKRSDQQTKKDGANFRIHILLSSLERSVDCAGCCGRKTAELPRTAVLPVLPPDLGHTLGVNILAEASMSLPSPRASVGIRNSKFRQSGWKIYLKRTVLWPA